MTEPIPLHTKTDPVEQQFPVPLQLNESKVRLSCSSDFDKSRSESVQDTTTKTIPQGAPLPTEHSKNHDSAWDSL